MMNINRYTTIQLLIVVVLLLLSCCTITIDGSIEEGSVIKFPITKYSNIKKLTLDLNQQQQQKKRKNDDDDYADDNNKDMGGSISGSTHETYNKHLKNLIVERVSDTPSHAKVVKYITDQFKDDSNWIVEHDTFTDSTPFGYKKFTNIIVTSKSDDPLAQTLLLACHFDSKYFKDFKFVAAVDSAVSVAMMIEIGKLLAEKGLLLNSNKRLILIFFDGEEAFENWTDLDSLYGSRHLANKFANTTITHNGVSKRFYDTVDLFMLLDLIGAADPQFFIYHKPTEHLYKRLSEIEDKLSAKRIISYKPKKYFNGIFLNQEVQDDHIPFHPHKIPILHLITLPFPPCWHKECDNHASLDSTSIQDLSKIFTVFIASYLQPGE